MIQINLLSQTDRRAGRKRLARQGGGGFESFLLFALVLFVVGSVGGVGYYSWSSVHQEKLTEQALERDLAAVKAEIDGLSDKAKEIQRLRQMFTNQLEVLNALDSPDRIIWAQKIDMLAELNPKNIFLTSVEVQENIVEVEIQSSIDARAKWEEDGKEGAAPEVVTKPIINYDVTLTGLATGSDSNEQFQHVLEYNTALMNHERVEESGETHRFMDNFQDEITWVNVVAAEYEGVDVREFVFALSSIPVTSRNSASAGSKPNNNE